MAAPPTMRAWRAHGYNDDPANVVAALQLEAEVPTPEAKPGQVLIKVHFASVNPIDWKIFTGHLHGMCPIEKFPYVPGFDVSGVVVATGEGVTRLKVGDRVAADLGAGESCRIGTTYGPGGAFGEYAAAPESIFSLVPENVSLSVAAALPLAGQTSYQALFTSKATSIKGEPLGQVTAGFKVLVLGGASGTGHLAVQLAKIRGATVATTASPNTLGDGRTKIEWLKSLGADVVINYREQDWAEELKGQNYDLIYDCVGQEGDWEKAKQVLKPGGDFVTIVRFETPESCEFNHKVGFVRVSLEDQDQLLAWAAEGKLNVYVERVFPFGDAPKALMRNLEGKSTGKLVIEVAGE